jgi:hypothetical protein
LKFLLFGILKDKAFAVFMVLRAGAHGVPKSPFLSVISEYDRVGRERLEWYDLSYWIGKLGLTVSPKEILNSFGNRILPR